MSVHAWTGAGYPEGFRKAVLERLDKSRDNWKECQQLRREVRGQFFAIDARNNRIRQESGLTIRRAADLSGDQSRAFQWAQTLVAEFERIQREAEARIKNWEARR